MKAITGFAKLRFQLATAVLACACLAVSCKPTHPSASESHCAFADSEFTTTLGICNIVAEYYVAHREWPQSKTQLEEQWQAMLDSAKQNRPQDEAADLSSFLSRFTVVEFRRRTDNLKLHFRFKSEPQGKIVDQAVMFRPGTTADDILQKATGKGD